MPRPFQDVKVYAIQDRRGEMTRTRPYMVRWTIDGRHRGRSFTTKAQADRYRRSLLSAVEGGAAFSLDTGEPEDWHTPLADLGVHEWARRWLAEQWPEWQPRTRTSAVEAIARFVCLTVRARSTPPTTLRRYLMTALRADALDGHDEQVEAWLSRHVLTLAELDRLLLAEVDRQLTQRLDGGPLAVTTATRYRTTARACVQGAVDVGALTENPWPRRTAARARRKVNRAAATHAIRALPDPATMAAAIDAIVTHQPASRRYRAMTAVAYYAGLRPSEVVMLRHRALTLPERGWGQIAVTEADISFDEPGDPKTGPRIVPIPPVLVTILQEWVSELGHTTPGQLLFRTAEGNRPNQANWRRAWHRALQAVGQSPIRVYDCRHAAATTWLSAGVPLGECARRLGHSVDTLVSTYVGALDGDQEIANERITRAISQPSC